MTIARERKAELHTCACGARFELAYFDDRGDARAAAPPVLAEVACPQCRKPRSVSVPAGAERTLVVEPADPIDEDEEGVGG